MEATLYRVESREAIRKIIDARGLSNRALSGMITTAEQSVSAMLSGSRSLTDKALAKMAKALNVPFDIVKYADPLQLEPYLKSDTEASNARPVGVYDPDVFQPVRIVRYKVWASFVDNFDEFNFNEIEDTVQVYLPDLSSPLTDTHLVFEILGDSMETTLMERAA